MEKTKTMLLMLVSGVLIFTLGFWVYSSKADISRFDLLAVAALTVIVLISVSVGIRRLRDQKKGLTVDDELSKRIKERAAAHSFIGSIYIWTILLLLFGDEGVAIEVIIGSGILGMALLFFGLWFYHTKKGISSENPY